MQHLAAQLADELLTSRPGVNASAQQWRALSPAATSIRLAAVLPGDVVAITGNLAVPGHIAMSLLPATSAAGRCAATAAPVLVEAHAPAQRATRGAANACCGLCKSTLYVPIVKDSCNSSSGSGSAAAHAACGCLVLSFRCSQHAAMVRSTPRLAQLAAALADVLPPALGPLRQMLATVLRQPEDPAAVGSLSADSIASSPGGSALQPFRSQSACSVGSPQLATESAGFADGGGGGVKPGPAFESGDTHSHGRKAEKTVDKSEKHQQKGRLPAATARQVPASANPFWLQYGSTQQEAEFAKWYALQSWQWDICVLVVCFSSLVVRLLRPSEHAFKFVPTASALAAAAVLVALCIATFCHRWYLKQREVVVMLVWGCMAHLVVSLGEATPARTPLWAARIVALEAALTFPLTFRVRFVHALPITALKCFASLSTLPQVLGCSCYDSVAMRFCTILAQTAQVLVFLVAPSFARHQLEVKTRQQFEAQQAHAGDRTATDPPRQASR